jgi:hypothetical protein
MIGQLAKSGKRLVLPTGEKARAVKARYLSLCWGCGAYTQPRNGKADTYAYCKACHRCAMRPKWTRNRGREQSAPAVWRSTPSRRGFPSALLGGKPGGKTGGKRGPNWPALTHRHRVTHQPVRAAIRLLSGRIAATKRRGRDSNPRRTERPEPVFETGTSATASTCSLPVRASMSPLPVIRRDEAITEVLPQAKVLRRNRHTQNVAPAFPALPLVSAVTDLAAPQDEPRNYASDLSRFSFSQVGKWFWLGTVSSTTAASLCVMRTMSDRRPVTRSL